MSDSASAPTVVCVLGMSRSGTSLTARVLNLAGVYLGPEEALLQKELHQLEGEGESVLVTARDANPGGFWEHYALMRLNERTLRRLGGNWREPPNPKPGWEASEELAAEREEARALLEETFAGHELWGWKDPRNSLTLPLWQRLIPQMLFVICLRNPLDVARSLERRDGLPIERGIELWRTYLTRALINTSGRPRLFVPYERYFDEPNAVASRLARFVGREGKFDDPEASRRLAEAVDERLWRQRTAAKDVVDDPRVPADAASLYLITELLATTQSGPGERWAALGTAADLYASGLDGQDAGQSP